jgi:uncharacterized membrane protein (DUF373 family)
VTDQTPTQGPEPDVTADTGKEHVSTHTVLRLTERFKRIIAGVLLVLMCLLVTIATVELAVGMLAWILPGASVEAVKVVLSEADLLAAFGVFLTVLIALELVETVEVYFRDHAVHVEIVLVVALIALSRKIILLDLHDYEPLTLISIGVIILSLGLSYYLVRRAGPAE